MVIGSLSMARGALRGALWVAAVVAASAAAGMAFQHHRAAQAALEVAREDARLARMELAQLRAAQWEASAAAMVESANITNELERVRTNADTIAVAARARAADASARAAAADVRVLEYARQLAAGGAGGGEGGAADPGAPQQCADARAAAAMLADMLGRALDHGRVVAGAADEWAGAAGQCAAFYDAVKGRLDLAADAAQATASGAVTAAE